MGNRIGKSPWAWFKAIYSVLLLIFSIVIVMALIFERKTKISQDVHPALAFILLWFALFWLSFVEGGQASLVGLPPIDRSLYKESHPITWRICEHHHKGDNLDRYLLGRQFMVLALVFIINSCGAPTKDAEVLGLPEILTKIFLKSGLAMILFTCMIGQLQTQVNATHCMLDFINDWANFLTVKVAMCIEASGLLHASYLLQIIVGLLARKKIESNEPPRSPFMNVLFWGRVLMSCALLVFAWVITMVALFTGKSTVWESMPEIVALILFLVLMGVVGSLEGMQVAYFLAAKLSDEERNRNIWSKRQCDILFGGEGHNFPGFMVGRQLCVVACFFIIARVTSMEILPGEENVLGFGDTAQAFFNTGLLGAFITTIVASITWQLVATAFPLVFMSNPFTYLLLRICLFLEGTGLCMGAFVLAAIHRKVSGFQRDEVYVGTPEERAAMQHADMDPHNAGVGHMAGMALPAGQKDAGDIGQILPTVFHGDYVEKRSMILANIKSLREQMNLADTATEKQIYATALKKEVAALKEVNDADPSAGNNLANIKTLES